MSAQHTPGPWCIGHDCNDGDTRGLASIVDERGRNVATAAVRFNRDLPMHRNETLLQYTARASEAGERHANARLIAAAPDLLQVLVEMVEMMDCGDEPGAGSPWAAKARAAIARATGASA